MIDKLHYISQPATGGSHLSSIKNALDAGCKWIQLRIKDQPLNFIQSQAQQAAELCNSYGAKLIVNDHPEIALQSGAYGIHLGLDDMSVSEARLIVGNKLVIGGTANTFEHVRQRITEGVNYIGLGPYRFTTTKKKLGPILGTAGYASILSAARQAGIHIPIIAIGGITPDDIPAILQTGVHGVAMSGAITHAHDRYATVQHIYEYLSCNITINV